MDLEEVLGLDGSGMGEGEEAVDMSDHGVDVWVIDARRPWNLGNVFGSSTAIQQSEDGAVVVRRPGVDQGRVLPTYVSGKGGVIVYDDGEIESELMAERDAFVALQDMPEITEDDLMLEGQDSDDEAEDEEPSSSQSRKRKASSQNSETEGDSEDEDRPRQRRRSNSSTPIPSSPGGNPHSGQRGSQTPPTSSRAQSPDMAMPSSPPKAPSARSLRRKLLKMRRKHEATLDAYYTLGTSNSEPISSMMYSLASELGREDNDLLWSAIVGISSVDLSPFARSKRHRTEGGKRVLDKQEQIREVLQDEVRRLNPVPEDEIRKSQSQYGVIQTKARSPTDTSIRLSPEPRFLLIRHWSLYDSMLHSPYLSTRLHIWSDAGRKRLHKLLAKMGISLQEAGKGYIHMDMELKQSLRERILKFAPQYNLDGLVPGEDGRRGLEGWGFVRSWGWKATLSAVDVATIASAILEVGAEPHLAQATNTSSHNLQGQHSYNHRVRSLPTPPHSDTDASDQHASPTDPDWTSDRFYAAFDALKPNSDGLDLLLKHVPTAQHLSRAILRTGSALIAKKQIRHLRSFRMGVVKEGPDVPLFAHPGALVKLAAWLAEAVAVLEAEKGRKRREADEALVLGCLDESRGVYMVVGLGGGAAGKKVRSKAEIKEREERKKRKSADKAAKKAERARKRRERKILQREREEALGILDSDAEDNDSDATESEAESSASGSGSDSDSEDEVMAERRKRRGYGLNRFGQVFQEVVEETGARVRIDSFEHSVVEVRKEDLGGFLEALTARSVVG